MLKISNVNFYICFEAKELHEPRIRQGNGKLKNILRLLSLSCNYQWNHLLFKIELHGGRIILEKQKVLQIFSNFWNFMEGNEALAYF
jgi:hypothetical protein